MKKEFTRPFSAIGFALIQLLSADFLNKMYRDYRAHYNFSLPYHLTRISLLLILSALFALVVHIWLNTSKNKNATLIGFAITTFVVAFAPYLLVFVPTSAFFTSLLFQGSELMIVFCGAILVKLFFSLKAKPKQL